MAGRRLQMMLAFISRRLVHPRFVRSFSAEVNPNRIHRRRRPPLTVICGCGGRLNEMTTKLGEASDRLGDYSCLDYDTLTFVSGCNQFTNRKFTKPIKNVFKSITRRRRPWQFGDWQTPPSLCLPPPPSERTAQIARIAWIPIGLIAGLV